MIPMSYHHHPASIIHQPSPIIQHPSSILYHLSSIIIIIIIIIVIVIVIIISGFVEWGNFFPKNQSQDPRFQPAPQLFGGLNAPPSPQMHFSLVFAHALMQNKSAMRKASIVRWKYQHKGACPWCMVELQNWPG